MKWHCANDFFKYCSETPDWKEKPVLKQVAGQETLKGQTAAEDYLGGTCKLNPKTCGKCQSLTEQIPPEELEKISKSSYIQTIIPIKAEKEKETKPKSAKAKKLEQEMAQRSMF